MKLWRFSDPCQYEYAQASRRGSWKRSPSRRVKPLIIEWEPGSDMVGDFTWPGFDSDIIVKDRVAKALEAADVPGFELGPVHMQENSEPAKRRSKKPMIKLPYSGPNLWDLWVTAWTRLDRDRSTVTEERQEDGEAFYKVSGVEHEETTWDQQRMELVKWMQPRIRGEGVFVPPIRGIFRVEETPGDPGSVEISSGRKPNTKRPQTIPLELRAKTPAATRRQPSASSGGGVSSGVALACGAGYAALIMDPNGPSLLDRYKDRPFLRVLDMYVLDRIDELDADDRQFLEEITPLLRRSFGCPDEEASWQQIVAREMRFPAHIDQLIEEVWIRSRKAAADRDLPLSARQFAALFVDANLVQPGTGPGSD